MNRTDAYIIRSNQNRKIIPFSDLNNYLAFYLDS